jgi:CheY-like chemotaxis protein
VNPSSPVKILVVDDEQSLLDVVNAMLSDAGYSVATAVNPKAAVAWLESVNWKVDLIISDVLMPEMDGLSFLRIVRQRAPKIPLLLISAFVVAEDLWGEHSRVPFLAKPFRHQELLHAVESCLTQYRDSHPPF